MRNIIYEHVNWHPVDRDLHIFGCALSLALVIMTDVSAYRLHDIPPMSVETLPSAVLLLLIASIRPHILLWPYRILNVLFVPAGFALQCLTLSIFFYGILTPVGLMLRIFHCDLLRRGFDQQRLTYWESHRKTDDPQRYFTQF